MPGWKTVVADEAPPEKYNRVGAERADTGELACNVQGERHVRIERARACIGEDARSSGWRAPALSLWDWIAASPMILPWLGLMTKPDGLTVIVPVPLL